MLNSAYFLKFYYLFRTRFLIILNFFFRIIILRLSLEWILRLAFQEGVINNNYFSGSFLLLKLVCTGQEWVASVKRVIGFF